MRKEAEREVVDKKVDKVDKEVDKVDKQMDKVVARREERTMVATSAGKIVVLQRAIAGWSKPSGEL